MKSEASPILKSLRAEISHARKAIQENFNKALASLSSTDFLDDIRESIIDDQRVLAVKSAYKKRVLGRVLGLSKTGSITYIQPESVVKHQFKLREDIEEEKKEVDKILRKLTAEIAEFQPQLSSYQEYIFDLDLTRAKAKFAEKIGGVLPKINPHKTLRLVNAYHPLLLIRNREEKKQIFPQTFTLTEHNRILCISGPNAGGKSITLKTVGLLQLMIQSGILVPVHPKSEMFFFDHIMTDIGDNQSIENHLSTYSSRLKKMAGIIREADENTLLLIDEPEISLHIAWQKKFLADLRRIIALSPMDVMISTHSPQLISGNIDLSDYSNIFDYLEVRNKILEISFRIGFH